MKRPAALERNKKTDLPDGYRSLFDNAVEGIYRTLPEGRYVIANPSLARIYGSEPPEALIASLTDIAGSLYVDPEDRERFKQMFTSDEVVENFEARVYRRDGSIIWISENAWVVRDTDGSVLCYEGTVEDISARKHAEEVQR